MTTTKIVAASAIVATASAFAPTVAFQPRLRTNGVTGVSMKQFPFDSKVSKAIGNAVPPAPVITSESFSFSSGGSSSAAPAAASTRKAGKGPKNGSAPVITVFDHRGCQRGGPDKEYTGPKSNSPDDEMCVKVKTEKIKVSDATATVVLQQVFGSLYTKK